MAGTHAIMKDIPYLCHHVAQKLSLVSFHAWFIWFQVVLSRSTQFKQHPVRGPNNPLSNFHPSRLQYDKYSFNCLEQAYHWLKLQHHNIDPAKLLTLTGPKLPFLARTLSHQLLPLPSVTWTGEHLTVMYSLLLARLAQDPLFKVSLQETHSYYISHPISDAFWGSDHSSSLNVFGLLLMMLRTFLDIALPLPPIPNTPSLACP